MPAADDCVRRLAGVPHQTSTFTDRQLPNKIRVDIVPDIEVRAGIIVVLAKRIRDERAIAPTKVPVSAFVLKTRGVIERMSPSVVEIKDQAVQTLPKRKGESVIVGVSDAGPRGEGAKLRLHKAHCRRLPITWVCCKGQPIVNFCLYICPVIA